MSYYVLVDDGETVEDMRLDGGPFATSDAACKHRDTLLGSRAIVVDEQTAKDAELI